MGARPAARARVRGGTVPGPSIGKQSESGPTLSGPRSRLSARKASSHQLPFSRKIKEIIHHHYHGPQRPTTVIFGALAEPFILPEPVASEKDERLERCEKGPT